MKARFILCCLWLLGALLLMPFDAAAQRKMVKILVSSPHVEHREYRPYGDVMAGTIARELNRAGGMEIVDRIKAEQYLKEQGVDIIINSREQALKAGEELSVDIVIFSTIRKSYGDFLYTIAFLEVERDVVQRTLYGDFRVSNSPEEIGRLMKKETEKLIRYIPMPSELADFGSVIREETIDYENLPVSSEEMVLPRMERFGFIEQIFSYYRTFPGEEEYEKFEKQQLMTRLTIREDMDEQLTSILNKFQIYGDFAIRHNLQAYLVKDCSARAINVLLANSIPILYIDGILVGYESLSPDGFCMYKTIDKQYIETFDLTHRKRVAVMFIVPKPGRKKGISKEYLEKAVGYYLDEWGKSPRLVEIKDSMFDIISSGLE